MPDISRLEKIAIFYASFGCTYWFESQTHHYIQAFKWNNYTLLATPNCNFHNMTMFIVLCNTHRCAAQSIKAINKSEKHLRDEQNFHAAVKISLS